MKNTQIKFVFILSFGLLLWRPIHAKTSFNVLNFGAKPDGVTDSTRAFIEAWDAACDTKDLTMIYVPKGRYLLKTLRFEGACKSPYISVRIDGILIAPENYRSFGEERNWISFNGVQGVSIIGGSFDAKGSSLWACKATRSDCPKGVTTLTFIDSSNIRVEGLLSLNSQMFHIVVNRCRNVHMESIRIIAPADSPNTDGIHIQLSDDVMVKNTTIKTGDDCISIGPGTKNLWVERVTCGPGHGISIGSLAKDDEEKGVQNVTVKKTVLTGTDNGLRIKSWPRPSSGFVERVRFLEAIMINVKYPILIDQNYCPGNTNCPNMESGVRINDVIYTGIIGTSSSKVAIKMDSSSRFPCTKIRMQNINLTYAHEPALTSCSNVVGKTLGFIQPKGCF